MYYGSFPVDILYKSSIKNVHSNCSIFQSKSFKHVLSNRLLSELLLDCQIYFSAKAKFDKFIKG